MKPESMIEVRNPSYVAVPSDNRLRSLPFPTLGQGARLRLGLMNNMKPNLAELLGLVRDGLSSRYDVEARDFIKPDAGHPAASETVAACHEFADVAIVAIGD